MRIALRGLYFGFRIKNCVFIAPGIFCDAFISVFGLDAVLSSRKQRSLYVRVYLEDDLRGSRLQVKAVFLKL